MSEPLIRPTRVKHFCNIGDAVAHLAGFKKYHAMTGRKIIWCQQLNVPATYYQGAVHPTLDDSGKGVQVMCNRKMYDMIRPLLISQEYVQDVEVFEGQPIGVDLDLIRKERYVNLPNQAIQQWPFLAYPDLAADLSKIWLDVPEVDISDCYLKDSNFVATKVPLENLEGKVLINFTERYRNAHLNYFFLRQYQDRLIFSGTENEHKVFCETWKLNIPLLVVSDFLQLAYIIKKVKFILCNQSFQWNVSFAMKTPHLLELCDAAPNCQAFFYEKSLAYLHQPSIKYYFDLLLK